jgi:hypothetical protein
MFGGPGYSAGNSGGATEKHRATESKNQIPALATFPHREAKSNHGSESGIEMANDGSVAYARAAQ